MSTQLTDTAHSNGSLKALNGLLTNNKSVQSNDSSHEQNRTVKSKAQACLQCHRRSHVLARRKFGDAGGELRGIGDHRESP